MMEIATPYPTVCLLFAEYEVKGKSSYHVIDFKHISTFPSRHMAGLF
jgi:hypothetical protein